MMNEFCRNLELLNIFRSSLSIMHKKLNAFDKIKKLTKLIN